ncbi:MAG: phage protein [Plesiomonas shigelloides]
MTRHISGMDFDVNAGDVDLRVNTISLDISDESTVAQTRGVPDGFVAGAVGAEGEIELDTRNFNLLGDVAAKYGSWRAIPPLDFLFYANTGDEEMKVQAYGCKLMLSNLLNIDSKGGEKSSHKVKFIVTSPDFVHINGVRILSEEDVRGLMG